MDVRDVKMLEPRVAVAGVITDAHGRVVLVRRQEHTDEGGLWAFPGGKPHFGERLGAAVRREVAEETGLEARPTRILWVGDLVEETPVPAWHYVLVNYRCTLVGGHLRAGDDAVEAAWVPIQEAAKLPLGAEVQTVLDLLVD